MKRLTDKDNKGSIHQKWFTIVSWLICLLVLTFGYLLLISIDIKHERERCTFIAENESSHIITIIDCVMARTHTLTALVQDHNGDTSFFDGVADDVYNDVLRDTNVSLKNVAIAPGGIVSAVYPLAGNESLIGFNFLDTSHEGNLEAVEAYKKGDTILTNPFNLIQGGVGMAGRTPVILQQEDQTVLWGLVTVTIDFENIIKVLNLDNLFGMGLNYELSYITDNGQAHTMHKKGELKTNAVRSRFNVRNLTWELAVMPQRGWISTGRSIIAFVVILFLSVFAGGFAHMVLTLKEMNKKLLQISNTDRLTGCLNRRAYEDDLKQYADTGTKNDFVYVAIDVNGLKYTNDTLGHAAGDELICGLAACMKKSFMSFGKVYRIGGDEFAALIFAGAEQLERMKLNLNDSITSWKGKYVEQLTISAGYVQQCEFTNKSVFELAKIADQRMYDTKREYYQKNGHDRRTRG